MAEWVLKVAETRGETHRHTAEADSEQELRDRCAHPEYLIYSVRRCGGAHAVPGLPGRPCRDREW